MLGSDISVDLTMVDPEDANELDQNYEELKKVFDRADMDNSGSLDVEQLLVLANQLGHQMTKRHAQATFKRMVRLHEEPSIVTETNPYKSVCGHYHCL
jgi:Ca2+-binding EF-hand superfamily protein